MAVDVRCESRVDGHAEGVRCALKRSPPGAARCDRCARGKRRRNVFRPMDPATNPVAASKHRARNELRSPRKLLRNHVSSIARRIPVSTVGCALTPAPRTSFIMEMRFAVALLILTSLIASAPGKSAREEPKVLEKITPLPMALDPSFEFRKTKLFFMSEKGLKPSERAHD